MLEEFWPDLGKAFAAGLLGGGASVVIQWAAYKAVSPIRQLRARLGQNAKRHAWIERRLAAILAADLVGYSRLMNADEKARMNACLPIGGR